MPRAGAMTTPAAPSRSFIPIIALSGFASTFASRCSEPLVGVIARDLATDVQTIALLSAAFTLPYALCQPVLAPFGDALGKERIIKVCLAILVLALAASAFAPDAPILFGLRVVAGIGAGGCIPLSLALIGDRVAMAGRQVALSRYLVAVIMGQLLGSTIAGLVAEWIGWRGVFALAALIAAGAWGAISLGIATVPGAGRLNGAEAVARYRAILRNPRARALYAFVFVEGIAFFGLFPYLAPLLEGRGQGGPFEAGLVIASFAVGGLVYSALVAWLIRVLGLRRMLRTGGVLGAAALLALAAQASWTLDAAAMILLGLGFYMLHNSFQAQVTEVFPAARGSAVSLHAFSYFAGQALGVVILGFSIGAVGAPTSFLVCGLIALGIGLSAAAVLTGSGPAQPRAR